MVPTENSVQESVISWAESILVSINSDCKYLGCYNLYEGPLKPEGGVYGMLVNWLFMVPNGSAIAGNAKQRAMYVNALKRRGMKNGVSDLFLSLPVGRYHGCYLEIKRTSKSPISQAQEDWVELMLKTGYAAKICCGYQECVEYLQSYLQGSFKVS